jgi:hypothetical protein
LITAYLYVHRPLTIDLCSQGGQNNAALVHPKRRALACTL